MKGKLTLARKGVLLITIPFLLQVLFTVNYARLVYRVESLAQYQYYSKAVIGQINWIMLLLSVSMNSSFAYVLSNDKEYAKIANTALSQVSSGLHDLSELLPNEPQAFNQFDKVAISINQQLSRVVSNPVAMANLKSSMLSPALKSDWQNLFSAREHVLAVWRSSVTADSGDLPSNRIALQAALVTGALGDVVLAVFLVYMYNVNIAARLRSLADNTVRLAKNSPLREPQKGTDEISELDQFFHKMASELTSNREKLEASENRLRSLIENMPVGLIALDDALIVQSINDKALATLGIQAERAIGKPVSEVVVGIDVERLVKASSSRDDQYVNSPLEFEIVNGAGRKMTLELSLKRNQFQDETMQLLSIQDVTQRRELEEQREQFVHMVSHDLRNPLTSVQIALQNTLQGTYGHLPVKAQEKLARCEQSAVRLVSMVNTLLDLDRISSAESPLQLKVFNSVDLVADAVSTVEDLANAKTIRIETVETGISVTGDEDRLIQVLVNLLSNAIKFSPEHSTVKVDVGLSDDGVEFKVTDFGRGIDPIYHETIFEKYKQALPEDSRKGRGMGLGLTICKAIVEQHQGTIGVKSELNKGSTFWFTLPNP